MKGLETLSDSARRALEEWRDAVKKGLGDQLVALVVHGSAVRGEFRDGASDIDVVIVVRGATADKLASLRNPIRLGRMNARIEPLVLEADEIAGAADVFPLLYESIGRHNVVIHGRNPFGDVNVKPEHVRLRIEQELRDAQIRLRRLFIELANGSLRSALDRKLRQLREPLLALLQRKGQKLDDKLDVVLRAACETWSVDAAALTGDDVDKAHAALTALLDRAVRDVDGMEGT